MCNKKVDPERYVSCGSYELLVSNVAHQMNLKLMIEKCISSYFSEISLQFATKIKIKCASKKKIYFQEKNVFAVET